MTCQSLFKTALFAAAMSGALLLDGCGRRGLPVPLEPAVEQKAGQAAPSPTSDNPTADLPQKLPRGIDNNSLKAGARKTPTPFDFLL